MDQISLAFNFIKSKLPVTHAFPKALIICGSGLGGIGDTIDSPIAIPYAEIPGFHQTHVQGHRGELIFGFINMTPIICMLGRFHFYEGHSLEANTLPVRVAALFGVQYLVVTNAAGGVNSNYNVGDLMLINDHINVPGLAGWHPLRGPNLEAFGPRFLPLSDTYDLDLRVKFLETAKELFITRPVHEGTYFFAAGPTFETRAESRYIETVGGDAVGMSTVPEVIVARHCNIKVVGISLITNKALKEKPMLAADVLHGKHVVDQTLGMPTHSEVLETADEAANDVKLLVVEFIKKLA